MSTDEYQVSVTHRNLNHFFEGLGPPTGSAYLEVPLSRMNIIFLFSFIYELVYYYSRSSRDMRGPVAPHLRGIAWSLLRGANAALLQFRLLLRVSGLLY